MAVRGLRALSARRAVLLDALGTLVELEPPAPRLRDQLVHRFGLSVSEAAAQRAIEAEMSYYRAHFDEGRDQPSLQDLRRRCAQELWRELSRDAPAPEPSALVDVLMSSLRFRAYGDAPAALASLKDLGLVLVVVSNWDVSLPMVLERIGLIGRLDGVVTSAEVGARKPDREIFERALGIAGVSAEEAVHVGDSRRDDVEGARAAGIEAVLLNRGSSGSSDVLEIRSLSELPALVHY